MQRYYGTLKIINNFFKTKIQIFKKKLLFKVPKTTQNLKNIVADQPKKASLIIWDGCSRDVTLCVWSCSERGAWFFKMKTSVPISLGFTLNSIIIKIKKFNIKIGPVYKTRNSHFSSTKKREKKPFL